MLNVRLIPRLDIKGPNLVKGVHLEGLRVLGKPEHFARHYDDEGADELIFVDVVASLYGRNSLTDIIRRTASEIFIPLTVGGGLRSLDDIRDVLRAGADKVALNTAAVGRPELVREASRRFGSSTIVVSIEAVRRGDRWEAYTDNGRERTGLDAVTWAHRVVELGAGELLVTSVDREGTGTGFDLDLVRRIAESVPVPVIASGGAGSTQHIGEAFLAGRADAVAVASMAHYHLVKHNAVEAEFAPELNTAHLRLGRGFSRVQDESLGEIQRQLEKLGIACLHRRGQETQSP
ncbi:MAG: imidazole glycerol phosphate synthase subunit HisF [Deltaproteobacteria bacterium]|nr:imidazole glycerol phosphate synthase subunit HisF [Deltaproteobacteria bacterium]